MPVDGWTQSKKAESMRTLPEGLRLYVDKVLGVLLSQA